MDREHIEAAIKRGYVTPCEAKDMENAGRITHVTLHHNGDNEGLWVRLLVPDDGGLNDGEKVYGYLCNDSLFVEGRSWGTIVCAGTKERAFSKIVLDSEFFSNAEQCAAAFDEYFKTLKETEDANNNS